jgi:ABC-type nitrate/sulfonate/bicarbonate transport system substrate-binding protein
LNKVHRRYDHIVLYLQWYDQAQFAGFYVAKEKNFYDDVDIDIDIQARPKDKNKSWDVPKMVSSAGDSDSDQFRRAFGIWTGDQVLKQSRTNHLRITAIGAVFNRSLACYLVREDSEIFGPKDFSDKKIGIYPDYDDVTIYKWLVTKYKPAKEPHPVPLTPADDPVSMLSNKDIDVLPSYVINEPLEAEARGLDVRLIEPSYYNLRYYSDTLIVNTDTLHSHRDLVARFLQASEKGWRYALKDQQAAVKATLNRKGNFNDADRKQQMAMLAMVSLYVNPGSSMFEMNPETWKSMANVLSIGDAKLFASKDCGELCDFHVARESADLSGRTE